jgi:hypothetical protein
MKKELAKKSVHEQMIILSQQAGKIRQEIMDKMLTLATSAFGLVAALAWNDAVKEIFNDVFGEQQQIWAKIGYAVVVTVLVVLVTYLLSRWVGKSEAAIKEKKK